LPDRERTAYLPPVKQTVGFGLADHKERLLALRVLVIQRTMANARLRSIPLARPTRQGPSQDQVMDQIID